MTRTIDATSAALIDFAGTPEVCFGLIQRAKYYLPHLIISKDDYYKAYAKDGIAKDGYDQAYDDFQKAKLRSSNDVYYKYAIVLDKVAQPGDRDTIDLLKQLAKAGGNSTNEALKTLAKVVPQGDEDV